jgi:hypothetical protein
VVFVHPKCVEFGESGELNRRGEFVIVENELFEVWEVIEMVECSEGGVSCGSCEVVKV